MSPPIRVYAVVSRIPVSGSMRCMYTSSRGFQKYQKFVSAPMSTMFVPMQTMWSMIRESSQMRTRMYRHRSVTSIPHSFSTAIT
jgi:hypothetical protein